MSPIRNESSYETAGLEPGRTGHPRPARGLAGPARVGRAHGSSPLRLVNRVVDSLDVRLSRNRVPSGWLLEQLPGWRAYRDAWEPGQDPLFVELGELGTFRLLPDRRPYELKLVNPRIGDVRIWNPDKWPSALSTSTGQLYVSFRSSYLQLVGLEAACAFLDALERLLCGSTLCVPAAGPGAFQFDRVARADLAADTQERRDMVWADLDRFTCVSRKRDVWTTPYSQTVEEAFRAVLDGVGASQPPEDNKGCDSYAEKRQGPCARAARTVLQAFAGESLARLAVQHEAAVSRVVSGGDRRPQSVYFGRFASPLFARRYNKLLSLPVQDKLYMLDVWAANGWDGVSPVWRTEFSLSGDFLKALDLGDGPLDLRELGAFLAAIPHVWKYLTGRWLRHCNPSRDSNVSRWVSSPLWRVVSGAWEDAEPIVRARPEPKLDDVLMQAQARGRVVSLVAVHSSWQSGRPLDLETGELRDPAALYLEDLAAFLGSDSGRSAVLERRRRFGLDDLSDTYLSSVHRADRMAHGLGS